ncbi:MAG: hypothetical protein ACRERU_10350, partial [Methylococcales bacterium]
RAPRAARGVMTGSDNHRRDHRMGSVDWSVTVLCALETKYANVAAWLFVDLPCCYTEAAGFCSAVYAAELSK